MSDGGYRRVRCYELPPLDACRAAFVEAMGQTITWEDVDADLL